MTNHQKLEQRSKVEMKSNSQCMRWYMYQEHLKSSTYKLVADNHIEAVFGNQVQVLLSKVSYHKP